MPVHADFLTYVTDQLAAFASVTSRRMFGGVGLYARGLFFALIDDDTLYFKVDASNRDHYLQRGCTPFQPLLKRGDPLTLGYYSVPLDVLEDAEQLASWADQSWHVAAAKAAAQARRSADTASADKATAGARGRKKRAGATPRAAGKGAARKSVVTREAHGHQNGNAAATVKKPAARRRGAGAANGSPSLKHAVRTRRAAGKSQRDSGSSRAPLGANSARSTGMTRTRQRTSRATRRT